MGRNGCAGVVMIAPSWSTFLEELGFGPHPTSISSADRGPRKLPTEMLGRQAQQFRCHALTRTHAAVEDTVDN
jgi:hypothetical protein